MMTQDLPLQRHMAFLDSLHVEAHRWYRTMSHISTDLGMIAVSDLGKILHGCTYSIANSPPCETTVSLER